MANNGRFQPGQSGNAATQFKPGNRHRWRPGQSGNPAGIAGSRLRFEKTLYEPLLAPGSADAVADLLRDAVRNREPWSIQALQRLASETKQIHMAQVRRNRTAVKLAKDPVVRAPAVAHAGEDSKATDSPTTVEVNTRTPAHEAVETLLRPLAREAKQMPTTQLWRNRAAVKPANKPVVSAPRAADAGGQSGATDGLATPEVDGPTPFHGEQPESSNQVSLKHRYEEFCLAMVKDYLRALPPATRSQRFDETRSAIRRAVPQLRRNEVDEMAQREFESKIRAGLNLPTIQEFAARSV